MKKTIAFLSFFVLISAHLVGRNGWKTAKPFPGPVFIENKGLLPEKMDRIGKVGFSILSGAPVVLGEKGICFYLPDVKNGAKKKDKETTDPQDSVSSATQSQQARSNTVFMNWLGANPSPEIVAESPRSDYFTCILKDEDKLTGLQMKGYSRIVYKELYPGIDLILETALDKAGFKYSFRVSPGANPERIRLEFTGNDLTAINVQQGMLKLETGTGSLLHKDLLAFTEDKTTIPFSFSVTGNRVGFIADEKYDRSQALIIDPWVVNTLPTLSNNSFGFDVDYDYDGNLFVYGGGDAVGFVDFKVAKYNTAGVLQWTFLGVVPAVSWSSLGSGADNYPGNFMVDKSNGKTYVTQAFEVNGSRIVRLDAAGNYDNFVSQPNPFFLEAWDMAFDCNTGEVFAAGGGTNSNINFGVVNTVTGLVNGTNITGLSGFYQDIVNVANDFSGNIYTIFAGTDPLISNYIYLVNASRNGNVWAQPSGFFPLIEANNKPFFGSVNGVNSNGANLLAVNDNYLFYYDGEFLKAFNKVNGSGVGNPFFVGGLSLQQTGIAVDNCDNVYVGGTGAILAFNFNGSAFNSLPSIPIGAGVNRSVHDIRYNFSDNTLYVVGTDFAGVYPAAQSVNCNSLTVTATGGCSSTSLATVTTNLSGNTFQYIWFNSSGTIIQNTTTTSLTNTISGLAPGIYTVRVQVTGNCGGPAATDTIVVGGQGFSFSINGTDPTCPGVNDGSATATGFTGGTPPFSYNWSTTPAQTTVTASGLGPGNYSCIVTDAAGCTANASVTLAPAQPLSFNISKSDITCNGFSDGSATAIPPASGGPYSFAWQPGGGTSATITGLASGNYQCTITSVNGCTATSTVTITEPPVFTVSASFTDITCFGSGNGTATITPPATGAPFTYVWQPGGAVTASINNLIPGNYSCLVTNVQGCTTLAAVNINEPAQIVLSFLSTNVTCFGFSNGTATLIPPSTGGPFSYSWQPVVFGGNTANATNLPPGSYVCTLTDAQGCTALSPVITITEPPPIVISMPETDPVLPRDQVTVTPVVVGGTPGYTYAWSDSSSGPALTVFPEETTDYTLVITDSLGCIAEEDVRIVVADVSAFFIPRAFSPNGDGKNDGFTGFGREYVSGNFIVFDRWGNRVYETPRYEVPWNGRMRNDGEPCPEGVYVYRFEMINRKGKEKVFTGQVTLLR